MQRYNNISLWFFILIGLYFIVHTFIRTLISPALEQDEAEQLLLSQSLAWGYNSQPPLYTWLQVFVFSLFGKSIFSLALLKNTLLLCTYSFSFLSARIVLKNELFAALSALSIILLPQIGWESQRDLTHSVLLTTLCSILFYVTLLTIKYNRLSDFINLGIITGTVFLAKYNSILFVIALLSATLSIPNYRKQLLRPAFALSIIVALFIITPHLLWLTEHLYHADQSIDKMEISHTHPVMSRLSGAMDLITTIFAFIALLLFIFIPHFWRYWQTKRNKNDLLKQWLDRHLLISLGLMLAIILLFSVSNIKDRWLQPLLFLFPLWLFSHLSHTIPYAIMKRYSLIIGGVACIIIFILYARILFSEYSGTSTRLNYPYHSLNQALQKPLQIAMKQGNALIIAEGKLTGGNIALSYPKIAIIAPLFPPAEKIKPPYETFIIWSEKTNPSPFITSELKNFALQYSSVSAKTLEKSAEIISLPIHFDKGKIMHFYMLK